MDVDGALKRIQVRAAVQGCTNCGLREVATQPVPFRGPSPTTFAVVGEAPGKVEDAVGEPFVGPSGELLDGVLDGLLFDRSSLAYINAVSCFPDRTPTAGEINACGDNLKRQIDCVRPRYVLALGSVAVNALRGGAPRLGEIRGMFWHAQLGDYSDPPWVMATWHPAAVLRNGSLREQFESDIAYFGLMADQGIADQGLGQFCVKCGRPDVSYHYELPYCQTHLPKGKK